MLKKNSSLTIVGIGHSINDKSQCGNAFLHKKDAFILNMEISEPILKSNQIDGITVNFINIPDFNSDDDTEYATKLYNFFIGCTTGINAFFLIFDIQNFNLDSKIKRMITLFNFFFDHSFYWNQFGIIFTNCNEKSFNKDIAEREYKLKVINYIKKLPGCENIDLQPKCFYVDSSKWETDKSTQNEFNRAFNFALNLSPISTKKFTIPTKLKFVKIEKKDSLIDIKEIKEGRDVYLIKTFECNERKVFVDIKGNVTFSRPIATVNYTKRNFMYSVLPSPPIVTSHNSYRGYTCLIF